VRTLRRRDSLAMIDLLRAARDDGTLVCTFAHTRPMPHRDQSPQA